jgi:hypothetical protein
MNLIHRCLVLLLAACLAGCPSDANQLAGGLGPSVQVAAPVALAAPDARFNDRFTRFGDGWTGADGTYSVDLPDGRTVWIFGDTFLGRVNPDRSRSADTPLIRNCFVIQQDGRMTTRYSGTADSPRALVATGAADEWYWPADGSVEGAALEVFFRRFRQTGPGPWQWKWEGTVTASFSLPQLTLESLAPLHPDNGVMYGSSILETPVHTYIYGTEDLPEGKYAHLARATAGQLKGPWEFYTGTGWSVDANSSGRILEGVANQYSVLLMDAHYLLFTMDNRTPFSSRLVAFRAPAPAGPWQGPVHVYTAPEAGGDVVAYNAFAHPQFTEGGRLLVSYNLNSVSDLTRPYADADTYRPRFIRVDLGRLAELFADGETGKGKRN